jgi:hypothetical protein
MIPHDNGDGPAAPALLHHLKLSPNRNFHPVFGLLRRLDHLDAMDEMTPFVFHCTAGDILETLGPYIQDHIRRNRRS